jgi:hypothetical protein
VSSRKDIASSAAGRNALKDQATPVEVPDYGAMKITACYLKPDVVKKAIIQAGPGKFSMVLLPDEPAQNRDLRSRGRLDIRQTYPLLAIVGEKSVGSAGGASAQFSKTRINMSKLHKLSQ